MSEPSFASLNPALLARKGGAKPAMRRQFGASGANPPQAGSDLEDLGWNDLGAEQSPGAQDSGEQAEVVAIAQDADSPAIEPTSPAREQQEEIAARIEKAAKKPVHSKGKRAAFTLRLDPDRHLKLRLAATIHGVSAQKLVTQALDAQLAEIEDLETLTAKIKRK
jgi:hypothetical protein